MKSMARSTRLPCAWIRPSRCRASACSGSRCERLAAALFGHRKPAGMEVPQPRLVQRRGRVLCLLAGFSAYGPRLRTPALSLLIPDIATKQPRGQSQPQTVRRAKPDNDPTVARTSSLRANANRHCKAAIVVRARRCGPMAACGAGTTIRQARRASACCRPAIGRPIRKARRASARCAETLGKLGWSDGRNVESRCPLADRRGWPDRRGRGRAGRLRTGYDRDQQQCGVDRPAQARRAHTDGVRPDLRSAGRRIRRAASRGPTATSPAFRISSPRWAANGWGC